MADLAPRTDLRTHVVTNQVPPAGDRNLFDTDPALREALDREGGGWAADRLRAAGAVAGSEHVAELARLANTHSPTLRTHDRYGQRIDEVEFHPAWHELMSLAAEHEVGTVAWKHRESYGTVVRAALSIVFYQAEAGIMCPMSLSNAAPAVLRLVPEIAQVWEPLVLSTEHDPRSMPLPGKRGAMIAIAATEKQAGSDLRQTTTVAEPVGAGGPGGEYLLRGHKWFCSVPQADAFVTLARTGSGLSCFLMPRWLPDGTRNAVNVVRLKDKMGNKSNASSELEFDGAMAWMLGEEGRGVASMMGHIHRSRLDIATAPVGLMRQAVSAAVHHASHRSAFGGELSKQPLMRGVLADLALEAEASTALLMRIARAYDEEHTDEAARAFGRLGVAATKYWLNKRAVPVVAEAMEVHGGNGYVEDSPIARIFRETPLNGIWEGAGNVVCLDVLRAMRRDPGSVEAFLAEVDDASGADPRLDAAVADLRDLFDSVAYDEGLARLLVERMALTLQGSLLVRHAPAPVAEAFLAGRLSPGGGRVFGTLPSSVDADALIARAAGTA
ncbi:MAG: acyl-CoA dehydrogenase family protein [Pseudonocardia sediminis]